MKRRKNRLTEDVLKNSALAAAAETLKKKTSGAIETARAEKTLKEKGYTQREIALFAGKSRSAVANDLRLLSLEPKVISLIEQGKLSAGHARALIKAPKEKQLPFALETVKGGYSVRQTEFAVKMLLTPPEVLRAEKQAAANKDAGRLRALVEQMRAVLRMKVSLVGNAKKGRIYIDYFSAEELARLTQRIIAAEQGETQRE